jgi:hypothetical protein
MTLTVVPYLVLIKQQSFSRDDAGAIYVVYFESLTNRFATIFVIKSPENLSQWFMITNTFVSRTMVAAETYHGTDN